MMSVDEVKNLFIETLRAHGAFYVESDDVFEDLGEDFDPVDVFKHPNIRFIGRTGFSGGAECNTIKHVMLFDEHVVVQIYHDISNPDETILSYAIEEGDIDSANETLLSLINESVRDALDSVIQLTTLGPNGSPKLHAAVMALKIMSCNMPLEQGDES